MSERIVTFLTNEDKTAIDRSISSLSEEKMDKDVEPALMDIPRVFYGGTIPQDKTDTITPFRYVSKSLDLNCYCETKAQGNSSMSYPKKNQTTKLFADAACSEKLKVNFKGWGKQNKFCLKANWTDLSHARNVVSARIWGDVVRSRDNYDELPELLKTSPNMGAVDGFPVKVYANGVYQGRYTFNIPKDKWLTNMDDENPNHCILCGENYASGCFRAAAVIDGSDWTDEIHDTVPENILTRWNEIITFVMNSSDDEFVANLGNYFDVTSLIDYHLFGLASCNMDGFGKNQLFLTYDGQKWYASVYDMDATWGLNCNMLSFNPVDYARTSYEDYINSNGNLLYVRLAELFDADIKARWMVLREGALSVSNIINHFERFTDIASDTLVAEDYAETTANGAFTAIPLKDTNNIQQIRAYALARQNYVDSLLIEQTNLWKISDKTQETIAYKIPTDAGIVKVNYGQYYFPVSANGYWMGHNAESVNVVIEGEDVKLGLTKEGGSGYGIALPIKLEAGATYRVSYTVENKAILSIMYYDENMLYQESKKINSESECSVGETNSFEVVFTAPDYAYAFAVIVPPLDNGLEIQSIYRDIVIEKV